MSWKGIWGGVDLARYMSIQKHEKDILGAADGRADGGWREVD